MDGGFRPPRAGMERIPHRLARGGERSRRAGNVFYRKRRIASIAGYTTRKEETGRHEWHQQGCSATAAACKNFERAQQVQKGNMPGHPAWRVLISCPNRAIMLAMASRIKSFVIWGLRQTNRAAGQPEDLESQGQRVSPALQLQEAESSRGVSNAEHKRYSR